MPNVVYGNSSGSSVAVGNVGYTYPDGVDLKPGSRAVVNILEKVVRMADDSFAAMSTRHEKWKDIDATMKVFISPDEAERAVKAKDKRKPTSIVVPYSYAQRETILAYLTKAFLNDNIFQYDGFGPEDTIPAKLLELTVNQQVRRFKSTLEVHTSLSDSLTYGFGASTVNWSEKWGRKPVIREIPNFGSFGTQLPPTKIKVNQEALLYEGNEVIAIDPYRFLPDPNVSIHNIQAGEFVGWVEFMSYNKLLQLESSGSLYNVKYLKDQMYRNLKSKFTADNSNRMSKRDLGQTNSGQQQYVTVLHMYVTLIPKEWKLPGSEDNKKGELPEIWLFSIANECIVLRAQPLGLNHNMYPVATCAPDYDGYSVTPISRMEILDGLQTTLNWLFNSHIANVRKAINDMLIVDPSLINMEDLADPKPGKLIRLRRSAWGRGVEGAVKQLVVNDITRSNMNDADQIMNLMQKASGATDSTMGVQRTSSERVTASEFGSTFQMAISRLDHISRIISQQYLLDLSYFHASHTQQLMSEDTYVRAIGEWPDVLAKEFKRTGMDPTKPLAVTPFDIIADFDVVFRDGTTPTTDAMANDFWTKSFQAILSSDKLNMFDAGQIFKHMARINGAKNVNDFINEGQDIMAQVTPDQQVQEGVQSGNLIPLDQAGGGATDLG